MSPKVFKFARIIIILVGVTALVDVATTLYSGGTLMDSAKDLVFGLGMMCFYFVKPKQEG